MLPKPRSGKCSIDLILQCSGVSSGWGVCDDESEARLGIEIGGGRE